ncbi:DNRLRE domain-containing protein [Risungbinella massiliensis]|uniref:DNRLRE domain-containing protein n=1 Tax=Risungbinella massiliensis TaxID=1329796 RepID=UPI0005CC8262|nr:DNRLRE domain-containing protein [Risungbinella massiliensis]
MVAVKTTDGKVIPSRTQLTRLPKSGYTLQILQNGEDATISSSKPTTNLDMLDGEPWVMTGNNSGTYGKSRALFRFDTTSIPANAKVVDAKLDLWAWYMSRSAGTASTYTTHTLTKAFTDTTVTWGSHATSFNSTVLSSVTNITNDPKWQTWNVTSAVQSWINGATNFGLMVKHRDEASTTQGERVIYTNSDLTSAPQLRPKLSVLYIDKSAANSYYAPKTVSTMSSGQTYEAEITLTNATNKTWVGATDKLSYHWSNPDGTDIALDSANQIMTELKPIDSTGTPASTPVDVAPGQTITIKAQVKAPDLASQVLREGLILRWDLNQSGTWLSKSTDPVPTLNQYIRVESSGSRDLGIDGHNTTIDSDTGTGSASSVNLFRGNATFTYDVFDNPSHGFKTAVDITYNSLDTTDSSLGIGWSLNASSLMRIGSPSQNTAKVNSSDQIVSGEVFLIDDDGTTHKFVYDSIKKQFVDGPGTNMHLEYISGTDEYRKWVITDPERTQYVFDKKGYIREVKDNNGNFLKYIYEEKTINNQPQKLLKYIEDKDGRKTLTIDYTSTNKVDQITDASGRIVKFTYDPTGKLVKFVDGFGHTEAKTYEFTYHLLLDNILTVIKDPNGNLTTYEYYVDGVDKKKVQKVTNRKDETITYTNISKNEKIATDAKGNQTKYVMDDNGNPLSITNANNETTKFQYDSDYNLIRQEEANGAVTTWTYDSIGNILTVTDAENNAIADVSQRKSMKYEYQYSLNNYVSELIKKTTPEERSITYTYDTRGNVLTEQDAANNKNTITYHGTTGLIHTSTDKNGNVTTYGDPNAPDYGYHSTGQPKVIKDALGNVTKITYNQYGQILTVTNGLGKVSTFTYDVFGRPLTSKTPKDAAQNEYIVTPAPVYDGNDNVLESTSPTGAKTYFKYDKNDQLIEKILPKDNTTDPEIKWTYQYDVLGNLIQETEPKGNLTTDPDDYTTKYEYDKLNRLSKVTNSQGDAITYEYDDVGNQVKVTSPKGNLTPDNPNDYVQTTVYDKNHRVIKVIDTDGKAVENSYDADGNVIQTKDKEGHIVTKTYDNRSFLTDESYERQAGVLLKTRYQHDNMGNVIGVESPKGVATLTVDDFTEKTVYDKLGRVKEIIYSVDPNSTDPRDRIQHKMIYEYDAVGNQISVSTPPSEGQTDRLVTTFSYYDNGWIKSSTDPWNIKTEYQYNEEGAQTQRIITGSDGSVQRKMSWAFYLNGRLKQMVDDGLQASGSQADSVKKEFSYRYDPNGNLIETKDTSTGAIFDTYQTTYTPLNQVAQLDQLVSGQIKQTTKYTYDIHGNPLQQVYSQGIVDLSYNGLDQVNTMTHKKNATDPTPQVHSYTYTVNGQTNQITKPNGNKTNYTYYADGKLQQLETKKADGTSIQKHVLEYDLNGALTKDTYTGLDAENQAISSVYNYQYDSKNRLVGYQKTGTKTASESYVLDANSNIVQKIQNGKQISFQYDKNRLISQTADGKTSTYRYDPMGRVDQVTANRQVVEDFTYDPFDRTIAYEKTKDDGSKVKTNYTYDPMDRTISKTQQVGTTEEKTTNFHYLGMTEQVVSEEIAGQITKSYTYAPWGERLSMLKQDSGEVSYYQYNTDVDVEMLTDENGNVRSTYGYTPYGENDPDQFTGVDKLTATNPDQEMYNSYRYSGKSWDPQTQSYDLGFRSYFPSVGRFLSPDSYNDSVSNKGLVMDSMTNNLYNFTGGNPISFSDLDGHIPLENGGMYHDPVKAYVANTGRYYRMGGKVGKKAPKKVVKNAQKTYYSFKRSQTKPKVRSSASVRKVATQSKSNCKPPSCIQVHDGSTQSKKGTAGIVTGFIPVLGEAQDATILTLGYDPISNKKMSRAWGLFVFVPVVGATSVKIIADGLKSTSRSTVQRSSGSLRMNLQAFSNRFAGKINADNIPNMSKQEIFDGLPSNWKYTENNGFVHIRDDIGNIRMRIDPPDKVTKYDHVHLYDQKGNPLDVNLNIVDRKSADAHIPYKK